MAILIVADLSPVQREVWQAEQDYWALSKERDIEGLVALAHDRVTAWPQFATSPIDSANFRAGQQARDPIAGYELTFHVIEVHGDAAIAHLTAVTTGTAPSGGPLTKRQSCMTHIWVKGRGAWRLAGGMSR